MSKANNGEICAEVHAKKRELNKLTIKANLNFNVNSFKNWMKQKMIDDGKLFPKDGKQCLPKFSGSHVALTAMNEGLCYIILEKTIERITKDKTGLYNITFKDISDVIRVDSDLKKYFGQYMDMYDNTLNYKNQYCISEKVIKKYIDKVFSASVDITNNAFNLLVYILIKTCVRIIDTAFIMISFAKKRTMNPNAVLHSVSVHFDGNISHRLKMSIDEAIKLCGKEANDDCDKDDDEKNSGCENKTKDQHNKDEDDEDDDDNNDDNE